MESKFKKNLEKFLSRYRPLKLKKDELIYQPGDVLSSVYFIKSGYARIYIICRDGQEATIAILKPSFLFPTFFAGPKVKSRYYLETLAPAEIYQIPKKEFDDFVSNNLEVFPEMMDMIAAGFKGVLMRIEDLVTGNAYTKVIAVLLTLASDSGSKKTSVPVDLSLSHRIIASLTGLTRETVTLQILKLKKKGFVSGKGHTLIINDLPKLKEEIPCPSEENS